MPQINTLADTQEDRYDAEGNVSNCGIYDAGGHIIPERYAALRDYLRDYSNDSSDTRIIRE